MATGTDLKRLAMSLEGTTQGPHFDRTAFKVEKIYATLTADELTANFKFTPGQQELKCTVAPEAFKAIPNAFGKQGWTTGTLSEMTVAELTAALEAAWRHAIPKSRRKNP